MPAPDTSSSAVTGLCAGFTPITDLENSVLEGLKSRSLGTASALLGVWLFLVLFAYFGVLKLSGFVADSPFLTLLVMLVQAILVAELDCINSRQRIEQPPAVKI